MDKRFTGWRRRTYVHKLQMMILDGHHDWLPDDIKNNPSFIAWADAVNYIKQTKRPTIYADRMEVNSCRDSGDEIVLKCFFNRVMGKYTGDCMTVESPALYTTIAHVQAAIAKNWDIINNGKEFGDA